MSAKAVKKVYNIYRTIEASTSLALGGGSTMDMAKAVGILATNGGCPHDYKGIDNFLNLPLSLIAIPTTAGTCSEVSVSCVIMDTERGMGVGSLQEISASYSTQTQWWA